MTSDSKPNRPSILGIWRLGKPIHVGRATELTLAQPADAGGSPRWDYVVKRVTNVDQSIEDVRRIVQHSAAAHDVCHPNLVAVLDASGSGSFPYLVMPHLEGKNMRELMEHDSKPLPIALWLVRQTSQALAAMHSSGWVHGNIQPENMIVAPNGHVTLIDLGIATKANCVTKSAFRGSSEYAAPETQSGDVAALPSADVFALGRVLWKWLTNLEPINEQRLEPVAALVESMVSEDAHRRPGMDEIAKQLLQLEIESLGQHIGSDSRRAA